MAQEQGEYRVGRGKPPLHTRFRKGRSGNPRGPRRKDLPPLLLAALNEPVTVDRDGRRRRISKREAIVAQLVDKSADADPPLRGGLVKPAWFARYRAAELPARFERIVQSWDTVDKPAPAKAVAKAGATELADFSVCTS